MSKIRYVPALSIAIVLLAMFAPAYADHTDPSMPLAPNTENPAAEMVTRGEGTWQFIANFPPNPGTDLVFFKKGGDLYASSGTLGQGNEGHVGQRIIRLTKDGVVDPEWMYDHGSAHCTPVNPSVTGLQHDAAIGARFDPKVIIDTTDATGRCHDPNGAGLELIDITQLHKGNPPREIHLTRHLGFSHTVTVDAKRKWIVYNSTSQFSPPAASGDMPAGDRQWIDVLDIRSCLFRGKDAKLPLDEKRERCRPIVYRLPFAPSWSRQRNWYDGELRPGSEAACHDITATPGRIYCAALNATLIFDVSDIVNPETGNLRGTPLNCTVLDGTNTGAKVTDCADPAVTGYPTAENPGPQLKGWKFLGTFHHPGRDCLPPPGNNQTCNTNLFVESDQGVAVSHEADPTFNEDYMFVTDERGGGIVPPGASCFPTIDNPVGNGGAHAFDISDPTNINYAMTPAGEKAVYITNPITPESTFCDIHVMKPIAPNRFMTAYYTQGTRIVDFSRDENGKLSFNEVAAALVPDSNQWVAAPFKTTQNDDGTVTYFIMASDIQRGIDIYSWTGPAPGAAAPDGGSGMSVSSANAGLLALAFVLVPAAAVYGRRRRRS